MSTDKLEALLGVVEETDQLEFKQGMAGENTKHLVVTVHGIRTFGYWQERFETLLKDPENARAITVFHYKYGYFSTIAFLIPVLRWLVTLRFRKALLSLTSGSEWDRIDLVGHSFGTHILAWGLFGIPVNKRPKINTIILAGSVLKSGFPWEKLLSRSVRRLVNDCGTRDQILLLNQLTVLFTGMAGRLGFNGMTGTTFRNRFFELGHSGYFITDGLPSDEFMKHYWIPLLTTDAEVDPVDKRNSSALGGLVTTLLNNAEPIKLFVYLLPLLAAFFWISGLYLTADQERANATREATISRKNETIGLAAMSQSAALRKDYGAAVMLALAGWPRVGDEKRPFRQEIIDALSGSLPFLHEIGRIELKVGAAEAIYINQAGTIILRVDSGPIQVWDRKSLTLQHELGSVEDNFWAMAMSPDSTLLATGSRSGELKLYQLSDGKLLTSVRAHNDSIMDIAFAPDGITIATAASVPSDSIDNGAAKVWSARNLDAVVRLEGHAKSVQQIRYSPDGNLIATTSIDGILVSNAHTGAIVWPKQVEQSDLSSIGNSAEFIDNGKKIVATWTDGRSVVVDINSGTSTTLSACNNGLTTSFVSADLTKVLLACSDQKGVIMDAATLTTISEIKGRSIAANAAFSNDNRMLATSNWQGWGEVFDTSSGQLLQELTGHTDAILSLAFTPDDKLLTASADQTVRLWDISAFTTQSLPAFGEHPDPSLSSDGKELIIAASSFINIYKFEDRSTYKLAPDFEAFVDARFSPDRKRVVALNFVGDLFVITNPGAKVLVHAKRRAKIADYSPFGDAIAIATNDGTVKLLDAETGDERHDFGRVKGPDSTEVVAFVPDGALVFSPNGTYLAAGTDGVVKVWDVINKSLVTSFKHGTSGRTNWLAFSPDSSRLVVTGGVGDPTEVWQIPTTAAHPQIRLVDRHYSHEMAAFSPDGSRIVSVVGSSVAVWDARTGAAIALYGPDDEKLEWAFFRSNANSIVTLSTKGVAKIWNVPASGTVDAFRFACQTLGGTVSLDTISARFGLADLKPICGLGSEPLDFDPRHLASNQ